MAVIIIFFAFSGIIYFNTLSKFSKDSDFVNVDLKMCKPLATNPDIADITLEKFRAYYDQTTIRKEEREGLMNCYCYGRLKQDPFGGTVSNMKFDSFNPKDKRKWCGEWWAFFKV
jgi:hypothetical protein